ncbi:MAG: HupE/UreJ family protein [Woeseiaceae bacterium]
MTAFRTIVAGLLLCLLGSAHADVFRPAYLEIRELGEDRYHVLWKVPAQGNNQRLSVYVMFPDGTENLTESQPFITEGAWLEQWKIHHPGGLVGKTVRIQGKATGVTDVIARVERLDGSSQVERLQATAPQFEVRAPAGTFEIAWSYTILGVEHILGGIDHLLFVFALLLIVSGGKRIVATITAFTVAHSITLIAATLGWVSVPGPPVEAIIALSIVFVAAEVLHGLQGNPGLTARAPWIVAFSFGLLHGFGFAGALAETGLPQTSIPVALLMFNVGVEIGQLLFVVAVLALTAIGRKLIKRPPAWVVPAAAYSVGSVAAFWTIERVASFWS